MASLYLTSEVVREAIDMVRPMVEKLADDKVIGCDDLAVTVLDPLEGYVLSQNFFGDMDRVRSDDYNFSLHHAELSRSNRLNTRLIAHLPQLMKGDMRHGAGVILNDIAVGVYGGSPHFAEMIAHWVAAVCQALAVRERLKAHDMGEEF